MTTGFLGLATKTCRERRDATVSPGLHESSFSALNHLEDMKSLKLDILALVLEQIHHVLEIVFIGNVPSHDVEVGPV